MYFQRIGDLREDSDRKQVEVAKYLGVTQSTYSSYERGDTLRDALGSLRRGVRESVKLIGRGGRIEAWIPAAAAYGAEGDKTLGIGPNATLFYEIELVGVDKYAEWSRRNKLRR